MKLRILQVVSYYPPASSFGGPPQVMFDLGKKLIAKGHSVSVYTTDVMNIEDWKASIGKKDDEINGIK
ncbi:MAG: glycosyl transferase, partial [Chloroflexota bacterium]